MADDGSDNETWEDASDIFEVRSEAGSSEPVEDDRSEADTVIEAAPLPRGDRRARPARRETDRDPERDRDVDQRGASLELPVSVYGTVPSSYQTGQFRSRKGASPYRNRRPSPIKINKPVKARSLIKLPRFEGGNNCIESHLMQFDIVAKLWLVKRVVSCEI